MKDLRLPRPLEVVLCVVILLELVAPFVAKTYGVDGPSQLNLVKQFTRLVSAGVWIPRWVPEGYSGFGVASFYFYPPLSLYVASLIRIITGIIDPKVLYQMTGLIATVASFFTARVLLRSLGSRGYQLAIGSVLYAFAPMRIAELYSRSSLSTSVGYIFLPLVWAGLVLIVQGKGKWDVKGILLFGIASALLALTSVPFAVLTGICIVIAAIVFRRHITPHVLIGVALGGLLALMLTAAQLASILFASPFARLEDLRVTEPEYLINDLLHGGGLPAAYHVGLVYLAVVLAGFTYWKYRRAGDEKLFPERSLVLLVLCIAVMTAFLELPVVSVPFYASIPPFTIVQGVWRFYSHFVLFGAVLVGIARAPRIIGAARGIAWAWTLGAAIPVFLVVFNLHIFQHSTINYGDPTEYRPIHSLSRDSCVQVMKSHELDPPALASLQSSEYIRETAQTDQSESFDANLSAPRLVTFHRFEWPAWHLVAADREIATRPDSIGRATAVVPAGEYRMEWRLERSPMERAGLWTSFLGWTSLIVTRMGFFARRIFRKRSL